MQYPRRWRLRVEPSGEKWKFWREEPLELKKDGREIWLRLPEGDSFTEEEAKDAVESEARNSQWGVLPGGQTVLATCWLANSVLGDSGFDLNVTRRFYDRRIQQDGNH